MELIFLPRNLSKLAAFCATDEGRLGLEAAEAHDAHLADIQRRERLSRIIYPKGGSID